MQRDGSQRFCESCRHTVHDFAAMTEPQVRALLFVHSGKSLCARQVITPSGQLMVQRQQTPPEEPSSRWLARRMAVGFAGLSLSAAGCATTSSPAPSAMAAATNPAARELPTTTTLVAPASAPSADMDADGVPDTEDACPNQPGRVDARGCPTVVLGGIGHSQCQKERVYFERGASTLMPESLPLIAELSQAIKKFPESRVVLRGHASLKDGRARRRDQLAEKRAAAVRAALIEEGVNAAVLSVESAGDREPVDTNATAEGRQLNRRVELRFCPEG